MKKLLLTAIFAVGFLSSQAQRVVVGSRIMCFIDKMYASRQRLDCPSGEVKHNQFLQIWDAHWENPEKWVIECVDDRTTPMTIVIKPVNNLDYAITIKDNRYAEGNDIVLQRYTGASNQKWKLIGISDPVGYQQTNDYIVSAYNPQWCLKVDGEGKNHGEHIKLHKRISPSADKNSIWYINAQEVW